MKPRFVVGLIALAVVLTACGKSPSSNLVSGRGTVHPSSVECSAWFLHGDTGRTYQLTGLAPGFQHDGLRVRFTLERRRDILSTCMVGEIADVVSMSKL